MAPTWRIRNYVIYFLATSALVATLSACGSSTPTATNSGSTDAGGHSSAPAGVSKAAALTKEHERTPTLPSALTPLPTRPPTGKRILYMNCGVPLCKLIGQGVQQAATALGWTVQNLNSGATPESVANAWTQALTIKPSAVVDVGIPEVLFKHQLTQLWHEGIPTVAEAEGLDPLGNGLIANIYGSANADLRGSWMADWIIANSGGHAHALDLTTPDYPIFKPQVTDFQAQMKRLCPSCSTQVLSVPISAIGTTLGNQVVSAVQRDPSIKYIAGDMGDITAGVPQALSAAGITGVKIISANPDLPQMPQIKQGQEQAGVGEDNLLMGWLMMDALARYFEHQPIHEQAYNAPPHQLLTTANIKGIVGADNLFHVPGIRANFEKLWKVS